MTDSDVLMKVWLIWTLWATWRMYANAAKARKLKKQVEGQAEKIADDAETIKDYEEGRTPLIARSIDETFPMALGDAAIIIVVNDRAPQSNDLLNHHRPVVWLDAEHNTSWRWNDRDEIWEETTMLSADDQLAHMTAFTHDDVFVYAVAEIHHGARDALVEVNGADLATTEGQQQANRAIGRMSRTIARGMDLAAGGDAWTRIWESARGIGAPAEIEGRTMGSDAETGRRAQRVARSGLDNPFEDRRRPIRFDEDETPA